MMETQESGLHVRQSRKTLPHDVQEAALCCNSGYYELGAVWLQRILAMAKRCGASASILLGEMLFRESSTTRFGYGRLHGDVTHKERAYTHETTPTPLFHRVPGRDQLW